MTPGDRLPITRIASLPSLICLVVIMFVVSCSPSSSSHIGTWEGTVEQDGNLTIVRTLGGSVWEGSGRLEVERIIGSEEDEDYLLGSVVDIGAFNDRIYVLDKSFHKIRIYSLNGDHIIDAGREGEGPGEFRLPINLGVNPNNGSFYVRDINLVRVNVYSSLGSFNRAWKLRDMTMFNTPLVVSRTGTPYLYVDLTSVGRIRGMVGFDSEGSPIDTLDIPDRDIPWLHLEAHRNGRSNYQPLPFAPSKVWAMTPDRDIIFGFSEAYLFTISHADGGSTQVERLDGTVKVQTDEAAWYRARMTALMKRTDQNWSWNGPQIPSRKPAFDSIFSDLEGRIWVLRKGDGIWLKGGNQDAITYSEFNQNPCWRDSYWFDLFNREGYFLGSIRVPDELSISILPSVVNGRLIGLTHTDEGSPRITVYQVIVPTGH